MGRRGYPAEFRRRVLELIGSGRRVGDVARDLGISDQTVYSWRHQERSTKGSKRTTTGERAELIARVGGSESSRPNSPSTVRPRSC